MPQAIIEKLGPLAPLAGIWEGDKGDDTAPADDRGTEVNKFRERMTFEPFGPVNNHEQELYGLRYRTTAWRLGAEDPFHEEDTQIRIKGQSGIFHHVDENTVRRVGP